MLKSCNIDWWGCRVERCYLGRVGCGINSIRDIRIASETSRWPGPTTSAPAGEASTISRCTATADVPPAPAAAEAATAKATSSGICSKRADLQREINFSGIRCDLNLALLRRETEHGHVDSPSARSHIGEFEIARGIGECSKNAISLSGANGSARQRLACRFHRAGLRQQQ